MLSNIDIKNEIGRNLLIYPLKVSNIKGNSINLTASSLAWCVKGGIITDESFKDYTIPEGTKKNSEVLTVKPKTSIVFKKKGGKEVIVIPPHDTALIETEEVISVTNKLGGTYHSKVGLVSIGMGHIGTTLDPQYTGQSLVAVHNHTNEAVEIEVGSTFVSLILNYLNSKSTYPVTNQHGHVKLLNKIGIKLTDEENAELENEWKEKWDLLRPVMLESPEYIKFVENRKKEKERPVYLKKQFLLKVILPMIGVIAFALIIPFFYDKFYIKDTTLSTFKWVRDVAFSGVFVFILGLVANYSYIRFKEENE
ncbi:dCTP deaminase domain-containing protein [Fusibacter sp. JL216-2]|uniref:dCTP deaminase domain-containing protein n=1 Tax=Fusibacter sp. JL216-2 TaxID=3071453 RepID=UPI003D3312A2